METQIHVLYIGQETKAVDKIFQLIDGTKLKLQNDNLQQPALLIL